MIERIVSDILPYDIVLDMYQEYYRNALKTNLALSGHEYVENSNAYSDTLLRKLSLLRHSGRLRDLLNRMFSTVCPAGQLRDRLNGVLPHSLDALARILSHGPATLPSPSIGVYRFTTDQHEEFRVCIDANDPPDISEQAAASCDVYFKSNYWPSFSYPANVVPLPNMNPLVGQNLELFRNFRSVAKERDLFIFFRVWGGRLHQRQEGIEHNMKLLKALSKLKCNTYLLAYLVTGDIPSLGKRLDDLGIHWTTKSMPRLELWQNAASARLNIVRMGMHQCAPWRLIDILAMGGVPVMDYKPLTLWPEPLVEGKHYLDLDCPQGQEDAGKMANKIADKIDSWLQNESLLSSVSRNAADYFDRYLEPEKLGRAMMQTVEDRCFRAAGSPGRND